LQGETARLKNNEERASKMLAASLIQSHRYLFDTDLPDVRNAYDPEFRRVCDLYNQSLEGLLRIVNREKGLRPGSTHTIDLFGTPIEFMVQNDGRWELGDLERFEFVSDYRTKGLKNQYSTYGLGVPLIAVRETNKPSRPWEQFYPPGLAFSVTAFMEIKPIDSETAASSRQQCVLHLYDPLQKTWIQSGERMAPLESDMTTPLAYFLNDPLLNTQVLPTASLLNADLVKKFSGLYMLEPFDPEKIPVVLVHGLWSTPVTWTEMYNDLRSMEEIRANYQFWFYLYPTGQPFWISAKQMREDLAKVRKALDPWNESHALHNMVLVGHSMGGLVSDLQTIDSGDDFWKMVSDKSFASLKGDETALRELQGLFFFEANPSIRRVITIGTPHLGSSYANSTTQWIGRKFFQIPDLLESQSEKIVRENSDLIKDASFFSIKTSIDSLAPESKFFETMQKAQRPAGVRLHNIVGHIEEKNLIAKAFGTTEDGDGVVSLVSATAADALSEIEVAAEHANIHRHPLAILEVRRILLEHLREAKANVPR
jgi:pimeloyl-ACP methyl ester carboxylesterase